MASEIHRITRNKDTGLFETRTERIPDDPKVREEGRARAQINKRRKARKFINQMETVKIAEILTDSEMARGALTLASFALMPVLTLEQTEVKNRLEEKLADIEAIHARADELRTAAEVDPASVRKHTRGTPGYQIDGSVNGSGNWPEKRR